MSIERACQRPVTVERACVRYHEYNLFPPFRSRLFSFLFCFFLFFCAVFVGPSWFSESVLPQGQASGRHLHALHGHVPVPVRLRAAAALPEPQGRRHGGKGPHPAHGPAHVRAPPTRRHGGLIFLWFFLCIFIFLGWGVSVLPDVCTLQYIVGYTFA